MQDFFQNEQTATAFRAGHYEALRFKSGPHLLQQDVFKAETDDWRIYCGYDDVEDGNIIKITLKNRYRNGAPVVVTMQMGSARNAVARALRFIAQHPIQEPYCSVDY